MIINISKVIKNFFILYYNNTYIDFLAMAGGTSLKAVQERDKLKYNIKTSIIDPATWVLSLCFGISLAALIIYFFDINYNDLTLLLLLTVIRYSSFMMCICAFYKLSLNVYRSFKYRKFHLVRILLYLVIITYGIVVILLDAFIIALSGGN